MAIIIGIDPGSRMTGYGIIQQTGDKLTYIDAGTIRTETKEMPERLKRIFNGLTRIAQHHMKYSDEPIYTAVEQVFMAANPDSALKLGQARGAAIAALVALDLEVSEYTARQIKQAVCGYGAAAKEQVQEMVCRILALDVVPQEDAADGLACAICHAHSSHSMNKLLLNSGMSGRGATKKKGRWRLTEEDLNNRR
ncbi:crossover junction endodeoxyribonuclease RuvC [Psychrobacter sp. LV10R520-6]|uniref:crossover junction endodeoxyribonuclease RuvC n=1 Tax=Psychrobacter sp. LV10R520-6 TaxID=1415574 RepID=UPI0024CC8A15|nr:crossover junction endodeoxyribonuclease RuvC [Psychrobacter sp. LV10R520-6]SNT69309.1 Holliday junction endonuclease RuvC [Psychrobacter sp. LV10R520-6]